MDNKQSLEEFIKFREANNIAKNTIKGYRVTIGGLLQFTNGMNLYKITENDTRDFINSINKEGTRVQYVQRLILFFRWLHKKEKRERPDNMKWYVFPNKSNLIKNKDADVKKSLITDEEYAEIIQNCSNEPKWSALFETMYLSGGRPDEVNNMKIGDIEIDDNNKVTIILQKSKTIPRKVPLPETPKMLIRWQSFHPQKDDKDAPLFICQNRNHYGEQMNTISINTKFSFIKKHTKIKKTLTPHCFRKTRATIMFSSRDPVFDDREIGQVFGWKPHTVVDRRQQYDLRNFEDLKEKIQGKNKAHIESYDILKQEKRNLEEKHEKEIKINQERIEKLEKNINELMNGLNENLDKGIKVKKAFKEDQESTIEMDRQIDENKQREEQRKNKEAYEKDQRLNPPSERIEMSNKVKKEIKESGNLNDWSKKKLMKKQSSVDL